MEESGHELPNFLEKKFSNLFKLVDKRQIYPYSFVIRNSDIECYQEIHIALMSIIKCVVQNYHSDMRIRDIYRFHDKVQKIIDKYKDIPYLNIGAYRPDFLFESKNGTARLCEINARFPTNGYFMTLIGNEFEPNKNSSNKTIPKINQLLEDYKNYFDFNLTVCILKGKEKGYDINLLNEYFENLFYISPKDLKFEKKKLFFYSSKNEKIFVNQFILELHQDEILSIPEHILNHMIQYCKLLNDLRTIFMVHDKRFLNILSRDDILIDYLSIKNHRTIQKHRINTLLSQEVFSKYYEIANNKQKWLLKPAFLGKCKGIVLGKNLDQENWNKTLKLKKNFIIQEYIDQKNFFLPEIKNCNIVGTILCFNDSFNCPGIFRASKKSLFSLSKGGKILYPSVEPDFLINISNSPSVFKNHQPFFIKQNNFYQVESFSFKDSELYLDSLLKYGFVLLKLEFKDFGSNYLMSLLRSLNMQPRSHGKNDRDFVWNIKPYRTDPLAPRSHTDEIFQMHTDASYEINPPKYFALQCLHSDRFNGGQNLVIRLKDILKELNQSEIDLLVSLKVKIKVPQEFKRKDACEDFIIGSILFIKSGEILVRYRHDIIMDKEKLPENYIDALNKFESLINLEKSEIIKYFNLSDNQILIMDNSKFLHGRTKIFDQERQFIRIRFDSIENKYD